MKLNRKFFSIMLLLLLVVFLAGCLPREAFAPTGSNKNIKM